MASNTVTAALIVGSLISYLAAVALNAVLNIPGVSPFNVTIGDLSHKYETGITPSDATFSIWGLIYAWLFALALYCQTLLCRKANGTPLYVSPGFVSAGFLGSFVLTMIGNPAWIVVYLMEELKWASVLLVIGLGTAIVCLYSSCKSLDECSATMTKLDLIGDIWTTRIVIQNGCALYGGWVSCATILNFLSMFIYDYGYSKETCCYGGLALLNVIVVGWFILETFILDKELRYVFAHYIAFLAALSGSYTKNYDPAIGYTQYALGLLVLTAVFATLKVLLIIVRSIKDPIHYQPGMISDKPI